MPVKKVSVISKKGEPLFLGLNNVWGEFDDALMYKVELDAIHKMNVLPFKDECIIFTPLINTDNYKPENII